MSCKIYSNSNIQTNINLSHIVKSKRQDIHFRKRLYFRWFYKGHTLQIKNCVEQITLRHKAKTSHPGVVNTA